LIPHHQIFYSFPTRRSSDLFVFVINHRVHVAHVGDSRTYLIRNNRIIQITEDHSFVQEMVRQGQITQEEAEKHPNKNIITRAVGDRKSTRLNSSHVSISYAV